MYTLDTLKKRSDFLRLNKQGKKFVGKNMVVLSLKRPFTGEVVTDGVVTGEVATGEAEASSRAVIRVGYTVTKKLGNAVVRNRIKRRLREVSRMTLPLSGVPGFDYVIIGRKYALHAEFTAVLREMQTAMRYLSKTSS